MRPLRQTSSTLQLQEREDADVLKQQQVSCAQLMYQKVVPRDKAVGEADWESSKGHPRWHSPEKLTAWEPSLCLTWTRTLTGHPQVSFKLTMTKSTKDWCMPQRPRVHLEKSQWLQSPGGTMPRASGVTANLPKVRWQGEVYRAVTAWAWTMEAVDVGSNSGSPLTSWATELYEPWVLPLWNGCDNKICLTEFV